MCLYKYTHTYIYVYTHTYINMYTQVGTHVDFIGLNVLGNDTETLLNIFRFDHVWLLNFFNSNRREIQNSGDLNSELWMGKCFSGYHWKT